MPWKYSLYQVQVSKMRNSYFFFLQILRITWQSLETEHTHHLSCIKIYTPELSRLIGSIIPIYTFDELHVLFGKLEIEYLKVLFQSLEFRCFWNHHCIPLNAPAKSNLGRSLLVLLSQILEQNKGDEHLY